MRWRLAALVLTYAIMPCRIFARLDPTVCGTHAEKAKEELFLHRQALRHRQTGSIRPLDAQGDAAVSSRDAGQIALINDSNGVVVHRNPFDLNRKTLRFLPVTIAAMSYRFQLDDASYDQDAALYGTLVKLGDDDSQMVALPFAFPFFGNTYQQIYINSDGNATFTEGDAESTDRSFGRFTGGVPRIAPLFTDLDPTFAQQGVFVTSEAGRFVVSWVGVPLYSDSGFGRPETFQVRLYPDGRIEFTWSDVDVADAVVGIAPGRLQGTSAMLSFTAFAVGSEQEFNSAVGERFAGGDSVDIVSATQQFYATHEDAYDYLVIYNAENLAAAPGAVAYEVTVRNQRTGYGNSVFDIGQDFGSRGRLQAVLNMGPLSEYPVDPNAVVPARFLSRDTPMTVLGHEAGHLFLAYASVRDPNDPSGKPMLGRQLAHWSFLFNSEASLLEGNRIQDNGSNASPRFLTTATVQGYAPLDQYLMGFRAPEEVPATFLVTDSSQFIAASRSPQPQVEFNGNRRDIGVQELIDAMGRRTPDYTVAQRRFRFAFLLIVPAGTTPAPGLIAQLETYRSRFETFYQKAASDRASAETTLRRALHLSTFPAAGVLNGGASTATISLDTPASAPLDVLLESDSGAVAVPTVVTIAAGASETSFSVAGLAPGVDALTAMPVGGGYETAFAKIQVADSPASLQLQAVSRTAIQDERHIVLRVTDINNLPYGDVIVNASVTDGSLDSATAMSDAQGVVRFLWTPGSQATSVLTASIDNGPSVALTLGPQ